MVEPTPVFPQDKVVLQSNALTYSRHAFTACQLDLFFMLLAQLDQTDHPDKLYPVFISDIKAITGREWQIVQLRESVASMGSKAIEIEWGEDSGEIIWPFQKVTYWRGKGLLEILLSQDMRPLLFNLKQQFTVIQLRSVLSCTSRYAKRLYALACQWRTRGILTITIAELKELLYLKEPGSTKQKFTRFNDFKEKVLNIAVEQINAVTDVQLEIELMRKNGTNIYTSIKFYIGTRKDIQLEIDFNRSIEDQKIISFITAYGISEPVAEKMSKHFNFFQKTVERVKQEVMEGKEVKDLPAYIVGIFQKQKLL